MAVDQIYVFDSMAASRNAAGRHSTSSPKTGRELPLFWGNKRFLDAVMNQLGNREHIVYSWKGRKSSGKQGREESFLPQSEQQSGSQQIATSINVQA